MAKTDLFEPNTSAAMVSDVPGGDKPAKPIKATKAAKPIAVAPVPVIEASKGFPKAGDPYWKQHPLITEHQDGTVRYWGEDSTVNKNPNTLPKQMLPPASDQQNKPQKDISDKSKGYSSSYYPVNH